MRTLFILLTGIAVSLGACGSGGDDDKGSAAAGNGGGSTPGTRSGTSMGKCAASGAAECAAMTTYANCATAKCDAEYKAALGAGYASGSFTGGACSALMTCYMGCPCDATATTCESACATSVDSTCTSALFTLASCITGSCGAAPTCSGTTQTSTGTGTGTSTSGSGSCAKITACCTTLTAGANAAQYQGMCGSLATAGEATCQQILSGWQAGGICK